MALIDDLRAEQARKEAELTAQTQRAIDWAAELNRLINRKNQAVFNRSEWDGPIAEATAALNDAKYQMGLLPAQIAELKRQITKLINGTAAGMATGIPEETAYALAEKKMTDEITAEGTRKRIYLVIFIIILIIAAYFIYKKFFKK